MRPYIEQVEKNYTIRDFSKHTSSMELTWHRDKEDRWIEPLHFSNWKFQLDNKTPVSISKIFIPKGTYHRLIKGTGDLKLKVIKCKTS